MRILNTRDWRVPPGKISGLVRVAVFGDSLVYGQGVGPDETLSECLETQLNEEHPEAIFQAINCGVSGFNIWNSLTSMWNLPEFYDIVVLVLCENDTELFVRTSTVDYGPNKSELWEPSAPYHRLMREALTQAMYAFEKRDVPFLLAYYSVWNVASEHRVVEILEEMCREIGCPFVSLLEPIVARRLDHRAAIVSTYDAHPSALAHSTAARFLAKRIREFGWVAKLDRAREPQATVDDVYAFAKTMAREHAATDSVLRWTFGVLRAKKRDAARRALTGLGQDNAVDIYDRGLAVLGDAYAQWRSLARVAAFAGRLFSGECGLPIEFWSWEEALLRADELLLAAGTSDTDASEFCTRLPRRDIVSEGRADLAKTEEEMVAALANRLDRLERDLSSDAGPLSSLIAAGGRAASLDSLGSLTELSAALMRGMHNLMRRRDEAEKLLAECCYRDLHEQFSPSEEAEPLRNGCDERRLLARAAMTSLDAAVHGIGASRHYFDYLFEEKRSDPEFFTTILVYVQTFAQQSPPYMLDVFVDSEAPQRIVAKDGQYIGCDGLPAMIECRFPIFFRGRVRIRVDARRDALRGPRGRILKIEAFNDPSRRVVFGRERLHRMPTSGELDFPSMLIP